MHLHSPEFKISGIASDAELEDIVQHPHWLGRLYWQWSHYCIELQHQKTYNYFLVFLILSVGVMAGLEQDKSINSTSAFKRYTHSKCIEMLTLFSPAPPLGSTV